MPSQKQTPTPNKHGCLPPRGCTIPSDSRLPQVATGHEGKASYEAAFLVDTDGHDLYKTFAATVGSFATLKAWFAYRIRTQAIKDGLSEQNALLDLPTKLPDWQTVWNLIQEKGVVWTEQYRTQGPQINPWEVHPSLSALDLFAHVLIVLASHIKKNAQLESEGKMCRGFKWHQYYYEDEGKYFLLYRFMSYLNTIISPNRTMCIYRPTDADKSTLWLGTCGWKIHLAAQSYLRGECKSSIHMKAELTVLEIGWDPASMLSKALQSGMIKSSVLDNNKSVTFIFCGRQKRQVFKKDVKTIRQHARSNLRGSLKELFKVGKVVIRAVKNDKLIGSLNGLRASIKSSDNPIFWMYYEDEDHTTTTPATAQQTVQRDFSSHAILKLEPLIGKLDTQDQARSAQSRFNLIRENHRHSAEFVKELMESFAPLETAATSRWHKISDCKRICDDAAKDNAQFYKLRHLIADLSDTQQVHAQQYFTLANTNNPLASVAAENLIKLFTPDETETEEVSKMKGIFDEIKRDTSEDRGATHSTTV